MIDQYGILSNVVALVAGCVNDDASDAPCKYATFVGLGQPPADCSLISASWGRDQVLRRRDRCYLVVRSTFHVYLTKCCLKNDGEDFVPAFEDQDALCFYTDYHDVLECLLCGVKELVAQPGLGCEDEIVSGVILPDFVEGGCYGARFDLQFDWIRKCCP